MGSARYDWSGNIAAVCSHSKAIDELLRGSERGSRRASSRPHSLRSSTFFDTPDNFHSCCIGSSSNYTLVKLPFITIATMPWQRVDEISDYRLNTKKIDAWLKRKWGDYDYQIQVIYD